MVRKFVVFLFILQLSLNCPVFSQSKDTLVVDINKTLEKLISEEDTDNDRKITIEDTRQGTEEIGNKCFVLTDTSGIKIVIKGTYYLSNLLQELKLCEERGQNIGYILLSRIRENPVDRISRLIRDYYWDALTRRIDREHVFQIIKDPKIKNSTGKYLYVPSSDSFAYDYFLPLEELKGNQKINVRCVPDNVTPLWVQHLNGEHGLLSLDLEKGKNGKISGKPYVVPGGRFNEMYGWDSFFISLGLLQDGRVELARSMVDNLVYEIEHYDKILNGNRTYYLMRSQPPFLTTMAIAVYGKMAKNNASKQWLKRVLTSAVKEYENYWMNQNHLIPRFGLNRYYGAGIGPAPEVEAGHFDPIYRKYAEKYNMSVEVFKNKYLQGTIDVPELDEFFVNDRGVRESGHDTSYRWWIDGRNQCTHLLPVDLNCLLYKIEWDMAIVIKNEFGGVLRTSAGKRIRSSKWKERALKRKKRILKYLWDSKDKMFYDYDFVREKQHKYVNATALYPLWACFPDRNETLLVSRKEARLLVKNILDQIEQPGGIAASSLSSRGPISEKRPQRQWDYPYGWAPHQIIAWKGLINYGFKEIAQRLIYKWLYTIVKNSVNYNGTIPEKFNVVTRSHKVYAEYGNVGTNFSYITREGFGWMNSSYKIGLSLLNDSLQNKLKKILPQENILNWFFTKMRTL